MNTQENNKMIAEFMGYEEVIEMFKDENGFWNDINVFETSWDWLMSVVDKCYTSNIQHPNDDITQGLIDVDIKLTYKAVVEFINEYNKNK